MRCSRRYVEKNKKCGANNPKLKNTTKTKKCMKSVAAEKIACMKDAKRPISSFISKAVGMLSASIAVSLAFILL